MPEQDKRTFAFDDNILADLLKALPKPYATATRVDAATGLRPGALMGLSKQDIDFRNSVIRLSMQDATVSGGPMQRGPLKMKWSKRGVSFGPALKSILVPLYNNPGPDGRLFHDGGKTHVRRFRAVWAEARIELLELGSGWHQLRHYHASVLIPNGFSPVAVAACLGHKDGNETLRTYGHLWAATVRRRRRLQIRLWRPSNARPPRNRYRSATSQCLCRFCDYPE